MTEQFNPSEHLEELRNMIRESVEAAIEEVSSEKPATRELKSIPAGSFLERLRAGEFGNLFVLDVREAGEYDADNIGGFNIRLGDLHRRHPEIPRDRMVVVHCRSGKRSAISIRYLEDNFGFDNLYNLEGGLNAIRGITDCGCVKEKIQQAVVNGK